MPLPHVVVGKTDHHELMVLAMVAAGYPDAADDLLFKLERALIIPETDLADDIVRMGSVVKFWADSGKVREVSLVYPKNADISLGRVSVLTPVGTALIGLRAGEATTWEARDGREHTLRVMSVRQPQLVN